jgi:hypothetical protein
MPVPAPILTTICTKLKPGGYIWIAFPSLPSLSLPSVEGTLQFCDDPTHVNVPDIREISNILLANGVRVVHAGRSRAFLREMIGVVILPSALFRKMITGKLPAKGSGMSLDLKTTYLASANRAELKSPRLTLKRFKVNRRRLPTGFGGD